MVFKLGIAAIALHLILIAGSQTVSTAPPTSEFKTFTDWCLNREKLLPAAKHTVEVLLEYVDTFDCKQVNDQLTKRVAFYLRDRKISDIRPLQSLINLELLYLGGNEINDLSPLRSLNKLRSLDLGDSRISDVSPLKSLVKLEGLRGCFKSG